MVEIVKPKQDYKEIDCPFCRAKLRYTDEDIEQVYNERGIVCPTCEQFIAMEFVRPFKFPESFWLSSANTGAVEVSNNTTQQFVDDCVNYLRKQKGEGVKEDFVMSGTGNTMTFGFLDDDGISVYVAQNYYETFNED